MIFKTAAEPVPAGTCRNRRECRCRARGLQSDAWKEVEVGTRRASCRIGRRGCASEAEDADAVTDGAESERDGAPLQLAFVDLIGWIRSRKNNQLQQPRPHKTGARSRSQGPAGLHYCKQALLISSQPIRRPGSARRKVEIQRISLCLHE